MKFFDAGFFENRRNSFLIREGFDSSYVVSSFFDLISERYTAIITFLTILPLLYVVDPKLIILFTLSSLLQFSLSQRINKINRFYSLEEDYQSERSWRLRDALESNFYNLKSQGNVDTFIQKYVTERHKALIIQKDREKAYQKYDELSWLSNNLAMLITSTYIGYQVFAGNVTIGAFTLTISYSQQIMQFFSRMIDTVKDWQNLSFSFLKLDFLFQLKSRLITSLLPQPVPNEARQISLQNVSFTYPSYYEEEKAYLQAMAQHYQRELHRGSNNSYIERTLQQIQAFLQADDSIKQALQNVSVSVRKGEITALVGRNGSGKTTITHLLQHHYEPDAGQVLLNDQALSTLDQFELIGQFSWLQQQPFFLYRFSLRENLLLGTQKTISDTKIWKLLSSLQVASAVKKLPDGLDSVLGDDVNLSGGQLQLLAIARTLLQERPFLFFDEATSQLDVEKEFAVLQLLQQRKKNAGILFITHRMNIARKADKIYVVDNGRIKEQGSQAEMLRLHDTLSISIESSATCRDGVS